MSSAGTFSARVAKPTTQRELLATDCTSLPAKSVKTVLVKHQIT
jgi:hypothetical protein